MTTPTVPTMNPAPITKPLPKPPDPRPPDPSTPAHILDATEEIMRELSGRRGIDLYSYDEDIIDDIRRAISERLVRLLHVATTDLLSLCRDALDALHAHEVDWEYERGDGPGHGPIKDTDTMARLRAAITACSAPPSTPGGPQATANTPPTPEASP